MSYEIPGFTRSYEPAGDLSGSQFRFVKLAGGVIAAVSAATDDGVGVLQNRPKPKDQTTVALTSNPATSGTVMIDGVSRVRAGKALNAGVPVYLDAVGRVTDVVVAGGCVGITEEAATGADKLVAVLLKPLGAVGALA